MLCGITCCPVLSVYNSTAPGFYNELDLLMFPNPFLYSHWMWDPVISFIMAIISWLVPSAMSCTSAWLHSLAYANCKALEEYFMCNLTSWFKLLCSGSGSQNYLSVYRDVFLPHDLTSKLSYLLPVDLACTIHSRNKVSALPCLQ